MNALFFILPLVAVVLLMTPFIPLYKGITTGKKAKHAVLINLSAFFGLCLVAVLLPVGGLVSAAADTTEAAAAGAGLAQGLGYIAAALVTGLGAIASGIAVGAAAPAAIGAFSENPKNFSKALIFVALGEGIALYGLLISILIISSL